MKENTVPTSSLYERRKPKRTLPAILFIVLLIAFLLAAHFLNLFLQWTVIRLELGNKPVFNSPAYSFLGFSLFNQTEIAAVRYFENSSQPTRVFGFFDFFHPAIFAIWNKRETAFVDLGPIVMAVPAGFSRVAFFPGAVFLLQQGEKTASKYFGDAIVGRAWYDFLDKKFLDRKGHEKQRPGSFVVKALEKSRYLKIPYLVYFYLPLLLICAAVIHSGPGMLSACLYYVEMFFLFDYQNLFVKVPFGWISKFVNFEISEASTKFFAAALAIVFLACAIFGFWHWKNRESSVWKKRILLFFVLLPLLLYF